MIYIVFFSHGSFSICCCFPLELWEGHGINEATAAAGGLWIAWGNWAVPRERRLISHQRGKGKSLTWFGALGKGIQWNLMELVELSNWMVVKVYLLGFPTIKNDASYSWWWRLHPGCLGGWIQGIVPQMRSWGRKQPKGADTKGHSRCNFVQGFVEKRIYNAYLLNLIHVILFSVCHMNFEIFWNNLPRVVSSVSLEIRDNQYPTDFFCTKKTLFENQKDALSGGLGKIKTLGRLVSKRKSKISTQYQRTPNLWWLIFG